METLIGQQPESKFDLNKIIILKAVTKIPNQISAIVVVSTYNDAF
jgi:hypothetical protein